MLNKKYFWVLEIIALFYIFFIVTISYLNQTWIGLVFNSDILFIPDLFKDLAQGGYFHNWIIATTTMFFPDWLVYYIAYKITNILYLQFLIIAFLNVLLVYLMVRLIYSHFFEKKEIFIFSLTSILIFLFFVTKAIEPYIFITVIGQHIGGFIVGLFYVYLHFFIIKNRNDKSIFFILVMLSVLMGGSDVLFIIQFLLPILLTYTIMYWKKNINLNILFFYGIIPLGLAAVTFLITSIFVKSKIFNLFEFFSTSTINKNFLIKNKLNFIINNFKLFSQFYWPTVIYITFYFTIFFIFVLLVFKKKVNTKYINYDLKNTFLCIFITNSILISVLSFIFLDNDQVVRHLEPIFYFPILTFFFIFSFFKKCKKLTKYVNVISSLILISIILYYLTDFRKISNIKKKYYPYEVSCIDKALKNYDHYGIANYWTARPFTLFSKEKLHITEVFNNLAPFKFATNIEKVSSRNSYTFAIMNLTPIISTPNAIELDENYIVNINGTPHKKVICGGKKLLIYPNGTLKVQVFNQKGDSFIWPAFILSSQFSNVGINATNRYVKASEGKGFVSFGPYVNLIPGKYKVSISYVSNLGTNITIGYWDISSNSGSTVNYKFNLFGTNKIGKVINKKFLVTSNNSFEFRVYTYGKDNILFKGIKLIKID
jgi:hypothetical protein